MTEGWMADVVGQGEGLSEIGVQAQGGGHGSRDLRHFKGVCEAAAEVVSGVIAGKPGEHLRFARQPPEGPRVQNARTIPGKWCTVSVRPLAMLAMREFAVQPAAHGDARRQRSTGLKFLVHHGCCDLRLSSGYIAVGGV
jgi:hypothetical protein